MRRRGQCGSAGAMCGRFRCRSCGGRWSMAEQEPMLFPDTLANNIGFGAPDATEETILTAARAWHLHADVEQLPRREYETLVGERG